MGSRSLLGGVVLDLIGNLVASEMTEKKEWLLIAVVNQKAEWEKPRPR